MKRKRSHRISQFRVPLSPPDTQLEGIDEAENEEDDEKSSSGIRTNDKLVAVGESQLVMHATRFPSIGSESLGSFEVRKKSFPLIDALASGSSGGGLAQASKNKIKEPSEEVERIDAVGSLVNQAILTNLSPML